MAFAAFVSSVIAAALVLGGSAAAVELKGATKQVNPTSDAPGSVTPPELVADADGGFGVFWGRDVDQSMPSPDRLFVRFYDRKLKPAREAKRFDQPIGGDSPFYTVPAGAVRLGGGSIVAVWAAIFPSTTSARPPEVLGRAFEDGRPSGGVKALDTNMSPAQPLTPLELGNGQALIAWTDNDSPTDRSGRFLNADGSLGSATVDLSRDNGQFQQLVALRTGFMAVYVENSAGSDRQRIVVQVYDARGESNGGALKLTPFRDREKIGLFMALGLSSGDFAILSLIPTGPGAGDLRAQRYSRTGTALGGSVRLARNLPLRTVLAASSPDNGLLIARQETTPNGERIVFTRFSGAFGQVGPSARITAIPGIQLSSLKSLTNGRVAAGYLVDGTKLFVQTVKP